jgi:hypothetical protein
MDGKNGKYLDRISNFSFDKNLLSLEVCIGKPLLYVKEIFPQNVVLLMFVIVIELRLLRIDRLHFRRG